MDQIIYYLREYGYYLFLGWILLYFMVRRRHNADRARIMALFYQSIIFFVLSIAAVFIDQKELNPHWIWLAIGLVGIIAASFRKHIFPYPRLCANCNAVIPWKERWIYSNKNCSACRVEETDEEIKEEKE